MSCRCSQLFLFFVFCIALDTASADSVDISAKIAEDSIHTIEPCKKQNISALEIRGDTIERKTIFIEWLVPQIELVMEESPHLSFIPKSLIIAQAALESGWGGSTGAKKRFNFFGLTDKNGKNMRFTSFQEGLKRYLVTLSEHRSYRKFRAYLGIKSAPELTKYLVAYSENPEYSQLLQRIIQSNRLTELDG